MIQQAAQAALYGAINTATTGLVTGIYSPLPPQSGDGADDSAFPYITINLATSNPIDGISRKGATLIFNVGVWDRAQSWLTISAIENAITDEMHLEPVSISGAVLSAWRVEGWSRGVMGDGRTLQAVAQIRASYYRS